MQHRQRLFTLGLMPVLAALCAGSLANGDVPAGETLACCVAAEETVAAVASGAGQPWSGPALQNKTDPISGIPAAAAYFLDYADEENKVFGRIYFSSPETKSTAENSDLKQLYEAAFLTGEDGSKTAYGETRLNLGNFICPVSGVGGPPNVKRNFEPAMAVNCAAGACSVGDGYKINYNAAKIAVCCPACAKKFLEDPEHFITNIEEDVVDALENFK